MVKKLKWSKFPYSILQVESEQIQKKELFNEATVKIC